MIYLDYQATTPLAPEVRAAMLPWLDGPDGTGFANPHAPYAIGRAAAAAIAVAAERIVAALGLRNGRLVFTSGATEAAGWAIQSAARVSGRRAIVTIATEHPCVLNTVTALAAEGFEPRILPVGPDGLVDMGQARTAIDGDVGVVAAMSVNNEIGVIQPIDALAALAREAGAAMLCDAVQGFGRVALPQGCDMVAIAAHKVHGPKGVGALWLRDGFVLPPLLHGGGQQGGARAGTLSPALCVGFGEAARLLVERRDADRAHVEALWDRARAAFGPDWVLNGSVDARYHGNLSLRRDRLDVGRLLSELRDVAFSAGSACASGSGRPSHVLRAIGLSDRQARATIRIGFGRYTQAADIDRAAVAIEAAVARQREWA